MQMKKSIMILLMLSGIITPFIHAQSDTLFYKQQLGFNQFLYLVSHNNLEYAAEKFNVNISEAAAELAKICPNPYLSFDWFENREDKSRAGYGFISELGTTIELGGKRNARMTLANNEINLSQALLDDYFRNLRAEAATVYLEAIKQNQFYQVLLDSYETMKKLSDADSIRLSLGSIMETDAIQSKLEAGMLLNEVLQKEADLRIAFTQLNLIAGIQNKDTLFSPVDSIKILSRDFKLVDLVLTAQQNRADLEAARYNKEVSSNASDLAMKERRLDLDLKIAYGDEYYLPPGLPHTQSLAAGIAIPLKFSNFNKGDLKIAEFQEQQADKYLSYVQLKIRIEIMEAWQKYVSSKEQVKNFKTNLLNQSEKVLKGKIYSYERGETSLLEVLNAQRTYNEIQTSYIETLNNNYVALIELEKAAGIWDLNF
jgi:cobalt-zinc-cadmium efflux system outer membrane protein